MVKVRFFASLRERMGRPEQALAHRPDLTVREVWAAVAAGEPLAEGMLCAVNLEYVQLDHPVAEGDEVAFFPPVTGG